MSPNVLIKIKSKVNFQHAAIINLAISLEKEILLNLRTDINNKEQVPLDINTNFIANTLKMSTF